MTDIRVNLNKNINSQYVINWANVQAQSAKKSGTLAELNCAVLPTKKAGAHDVTMLALSELEKCYKALARNGKAATAINRQGVIDHMQRFLALSGLDSNWDINFIAAAGAKYRQATKTLDEGAVLSGLPTFKKSMLRLAIWAQAHGNVCTVEIKEKKTKKSDCVQFNIFDEMSKMSPEQLDALRKFLAAAG